MITTMSLRMKYFVIVLLFLLTHSGQIRGRHGPRLQIMPKDEIQSRPAGSSFFFSCTPIVENIELISNLQWKNSRGQTVPEDSKQNLFVEKGPNKDVISLYFQSITDDMEGTYTCEATYAGNEQIIANVQVDVIDQIRFVNAPDKQYLRLGENGHIFCEVTANPSATIQWRRNNVPIKTFDRYIIDHKGLIITDVKASDDGQYLCRASVSATGELTHKYITVEVLIPPKIEKMSSPIEVIEGQIGTATCKSVGKPPPKYRWIKENTKQDLKETSRFSVNENTGVLTINPVQIDDESFYQCVAENPASSAKEYVKIVVLKQPKVLEFINVTKAVGSEAVMACRASGKPAPMVTFEKLGSNYRFTNGVQFNDDRIGLEQENNGEEETTGVVKINNLMRTDDGLYTCIATNKVGESRKIGHLTTEFKPNFDHYKDNIPVWTWGNKVGNLSCLAVSVPNATITWKWNGKNIPRFENDTNFQQIGSGPLSNLIVNPNGNRQYYSRYRCIAKNLLGENEHYIELKEATIPGSVRQPQVDTSTATTIRFTLLGPELHIYENLPITAIVVQYMKYNDGYNWIDAMTKTWPKNSTYVLENLEPNVRYRFRFAARNEVGLSEQWSEEIIYKMPQKAPPKEPTFLNNFKENGVVISPYHDRHELHWQIPANNGEDIDYYELEYCPVQRPIDKWEVMGSCSIVNIQDSRLYPLSKYMLQGLSANMHYRIQLRAHNRIGFSLPAEVYLKTSRGMDVPMYVHSTQKISNGFLIGAMVVVIILILLLIDISCCVINRNGILSIVRDKIFNKSELADDEKFNSLYGWRFPLPYCSYKASAAHPNSLQIPQPIKYSQPSSFCEEKEPLRSPQEQPKTTIEIKKQSTSIQFDGKNVYTTPNGTENTYMGKHSIV